MPYIRLMALFAFLASAGQAASPPAKTATPPAKTATPAPYLNPRLPVHARVFDLVQRMTLEEKIGQMNQYVAPRYARVSEPGTLTDSLELMLKKGLIGSFLFVQDAAEANELQKIAENSRLKIPLLLGIDAVHGLCPVQGVTIFPVPLAMASAWDPDLVQKAMVVTARETRAVGMHWAFYPVLDVARDPRWGRYAETFGEDPFLVSRMGVAVVRGFQGDSLSSPENILACLKHLGAHSQPMSGKNTAPVEVSERTLRSVFLAPFQAAVGAGALSAMAAYHDINGVPCHASELLLNRYLRQEWHFRGFVVSDWDGIEMLESPHHVATDKKEAIRLAVAAGVDMHMQGNGFTRPLVELVKERKISKKRIDEAVSRILTAKFSLGLFENRYVDPQKAAGVLAAPEHRALSRELARRSMVLLKNEKKLLPLRKDLKSILVTGPNANNNALLGDWSAPQPENNVITVLEGIQAAVSGQTKVTYVDCGKIMEITPDRINQAVAAAKQAEMTILVIGENDTRYDDRGAFDRTRPERTGGEGVDRDNLNLAGGQLELLKALSQAGVPLAVVLINGRPVSEEWMYTNIATIVEAWEPGLEGGAAVAEVLFGDYNPGGKLPVTIARSVGQLPVFYNRPASAALRFKYSDLGPQFPFGYGLSYTEFKYTSLKVPAVLPKNQPLTVTVDVENTGKMAGDEVVLLFIKDLVGSLTPMVKELKAFQRISLKPGEKQTVRFPVPFPDLAVYNPAMKLAVEPGKFEAQVSNLTAGFEVK